MGHLYKTPWQWHIRAPNIDMLRKKHYKQAQGIRCKSWVFFICFSDIQRSTYNQAEVLPGSLRTLVCHAIYDVSVYRMWNVRGGPKIDTTSDCPKVRFGYHVYWVITIALIPWFGRNRRSHGVQACRKLCKALNKLCKEPCFTSSHFVLLVLNYALHDTGQHISSGTLPEIFVLFTEARWYFVWQCFIRYPERLYFLLHWQIYVFGLFLSE